MFKITDEYLFDVIGTSSAVLGLQGLACLAASSKAFRSASLAVAQQDAHILLQQTLQSAGGLQKQTQQQHLQAVAWLLKALLKHTCNSTPVIEKSAAAVAVILASLPAEGLIQLPAVPLTWAKRLVQAGVRITWAQLLEAARSMVLGLEVWVQALDQLDIQTDIPAAVSAMVRGEIWVSVYHMLLSGLEAHVPATAVHIHEAYVQAWPT